MTRLPTHAASPTGPGPHPRWRWRAAVAATALAILTAGPAACGATGRALGFGARSSADASIEVRNTASIGVNMYVLPRVGIREVFLGQVGPQSSRRIRIPGASPGDTVWLRSRPIDGSQEYARNDVVLGPQAVWQIP